MGSFDDFIPVMPKKKRIAAKEAGLCADGGSSAAGTAENSPAFQRREPFNSS
jgi:hypothetical protein